MNFFIGANNAGKSIVLDMVSGPMQTLLIYRKPSKIKASDRFIGAVSGKPKFLFGTHLSDFLENSAIQKLRDLSIESSRRILSPLAISNLIWRGIDRNEKFYFTDQPELTEATKIIQESLWSILWEEITRKSGGSISQHWIPDTYYHLANLKTPQPQQAQIIPAKRQLGPKSETFDDLSGKGLIDHLAELQNPSFDKQEYRAKFHKINMFLQSVTGKMDIKLEVPSGRDCLQVHIDNKVLPLDSLGTGIHEVVLIASFCTIHDNQIICLEEPEIHLHLILQKKLIRYLQDNTNNQYFIATHSPSFMDTPGAAIFHVRNDGIQTYVDHVVSKDGTRDVLDDLGYHPSDILQSNFVIWVEGPSDRIYLKHWIKSMDETLTEGIHYTIMFHGGSLIAHVSLEDARDDESLGDFIRLQDLCRNSAVVIDSDKSNKSTRLKPHAKRILEEVNSDHTYVWVTKGREIENYVPADSLHAAIQKAHPRTYQAPLETGQYDHAFYFKDIKRKTRQDANKTKVAKLVAEQPADLNILDLKSCIAKLCNRIRAANNLENQPQLIIENTA